MSIKSGRKANKKYYFPRLIIMLFIVMASLISYGLLFYLTLLASKHGGYATIGFNNYGEMYPEMIEYFLTFTFVLIGGSFIIYMGFKELKYNNK